MFLKDVNKKHIVLDKIKKNIYNNKEINLCMESSSIKNYELRQVWKEAAINSKFLCELLSIERLILNSMKKEVRKVWHMYLYIEDLDHLHLEN